MSIRIYWCHKIFWLRFSDETRWFTVVKMKSHISSTYLQLGAVTQVAWPLRFCMLRIVQRSDSLIKNRNRKTIDHSLLVFACLVTRLVFLQNSRNHFVFFRVSWFAGFCELKAASRLYRKCKAADLYHYTGWYCSLCLDKRVAFTVTWPFKLKIVSLPGARSSFSVKVFPLHVLKAGCQIITRLPDEGDQGSSYAAVLVNLNDPDKRDK